MDMRRVITLVEEASMGPIAYHGTTSKFLASIQERGLVSAPDHRVYDGDFTAYPGVYFSDTLAVAAYRAGLAANKFGGEPIVLICTPSGEQVGDEDAFLDFWDNELFSDRFDDNEFSAAPLDAEGDPDYDAEEEDVEASVELYRERYDLRSDITQIARSQFSEYFGCHAPSSFDSLLDHLITMGKVHDPYYKRLVDKIMRHVGSTPSGGNPDARDFRTIDGAVPEDIRCVVQIMGQPDDPSSLSVATKVIWGAPPPGATIRTLIR